MSINVPSTVVGVFTDNAQAELAVNELLQGGFSTDEISVSRAGATTGGFVENLKGLFSGQETTPGTTKDDFIRLGVREQDADYYRSELEAGRTIVVVRAGDLQQEALRILRVHGAYDINTRQS